MKLGEAKNKIKGLGEGKRMKYLIYGLYLSHTCKNLGFLVLQKEAKVVGLSCSRTKSNILCWKEEYPTLTSLTLGGVVFLYEGLRRKFD